MASTVPDLHVSYLFFSYCPYLVQHTGTFGLTYRNTIFGCSQYLGAKANRAAERHKNIFGKLMSLENCVYHKTFLENHFVVSGWREQFDRTLGVWVLEPQETVLLCFQRRMGPVNHLQFFGFLIGWLVGFFYFSLQVGRRIKLLWIIKQNLSNMGFLHHIVVPFK